MTEDELLKWGNENIGRLNEVGELTFKPGGACRSCPIKTTCRARAEENLKLEGYTMKKPAEVSTEEMGEILTRIDVLMAWAEDFKENARTEAMGRHLDVPGYKLVHGSVRRQYNNENKVMERLTSEYAEAVDMFAPRKLLPLTKLEAKMGREAFDDELVKKGLITHKQNKPRLVPEYDESPEMRLSTKLEDVIK